jgi:hypothetical protein
VRLHDLSAYMYIYVAYRKSLLEHQCQELATTRCALVSSAPHHQPHTQLLKEPRNQHPFATHLVSQTKGSNRLGSCIPRPLILGRC